MTCSSVQDLAASVWYFFGAGEVDRVGIEDLAECGMFHRPGEERGEARQPVVDSGRGEPRPSPLQFPAPGLDVERGDLGRALAGPGEEISHRLLLVTQQVGTPRGGGVGGSLGPERERVAERRLPFLPPD